MVGKSEVTITGDIKDVVTMLLAIQNSEDIVDVDVIIVRAIVELSSF